MFRKPFKVKSNSQIKGSERKKIRTQLVQQYPSFSSSNINELVPNKDEITHMKLLANNGHTITVYCIGQNPSFFVDENVIYPTVYTLWKFPDLLPVLTTWPLVFDKLIRGADLMLPGLIIDQDDENLDSLKIGDVCAVKLAGNKSAIAVGTLAVTGNELKLKGKKGKAMILVHIYKDLLYALGDCSELPLLEEKIYFSNEMNDDEDNGNNEVSSVSVIADNLERNLQVLDSNELALTEIDDLNSLEKNTDNENIECKKELSVTEQMDTLLLKCFLTALKSMGKNLQLPILTSTFYKSYILGCCPTDNQFDIKKTSYKKLSNFLQEMKMKNIINVEELSKGVESITEINLNHDLIKSFELDPDFMVNKTSDNETKETKSYQMPEIRELYTVNAAVLPFFTLMNYGLTVNIIFGEKLITQEEVNPVFSFISGESRCLNKMQQAHEIIFPGQPPIFKKGKLNQIEINVEQRTGNKKVTLINYLDEFKIDAEKFAHEIQLGVAASTKVGESAGKKGVQVLVQGNQVKYISKLLLDKYKIPKKYVKGYDMQGKKK
ncbi:eukaryotic translation initiation factor 2D-like [Centruroides sculpturatus]|uniref:eukaryotic translation initiation factor 2D-like n=1 Tax=Centruroides sculpturatus TaxID=218467 RepID=UPI000C6D69B6|nr:eukaryotic translation initiation factor 2D-like [Centruroides sculpturatus]